MKKLIAIFLVLFTLIPFPASADPFSNCSWGTILSGTYNSDSTFEKPLTSQQLTLIEHWDDTQHFWFPINNGRGQGYFVPASLTNHAIDYWFDFQTTTGHHTMIAWVVGDETYFFPFVRDTAFATTAYNFGTHGCADFKLPNALVQNILTGSNRAVSVIAHP